MSKAKNELYVESPVNGGQRVSNKLLTVNEVAMILRVSNMTVYRLVKNKQLPAIRVGKNYRIKEIDVDKYLDRGSG